VELRPGVLEGMALNPEFWRHRRVLITGHTGFKGSWLSLWLQGLGADLVGYGLEPPTDPSLYVLAEVEQGMQSVRGDILDFDHLLRTVAGFQPQIIFHLAAQPLVRRSYADPVGTYSINVLGTAHVLEAVRHTAAVEAVVVVTSDKCYEHSDKPQAFRESDRLGGFDPYSSSKAAAELVTAAFRQSFFGASKAFPGAGVRPGVATARAGNVIGGGDWGADRLVPDVMRATLSGGELRIRNPRAIRPWQHVLDPLCGYLMLAEKLCDDPQAFSQAWNFGPEEPETLPVSALLDRIGVLLGSAIAWRFDGGEHPHEAGCLRLDCSKAKTQLGWKPQWNLNAALEATVNWYKTYPSHPDIHSLTEQQIQSFQSTLDPTLMLQR
jgi:CDP-glucose 4,6-dehydratase